MNWLKYLLEANLYLSLFYAAYYLLLRRNTHYQLNRAYLLATSLLSFSIPFLELGILKPTIEIVEPIVNVQPTSPISATYYPIIIRDNLDNDQAVEPIDHYMWTYVAVVVMMTFSLIFRIIQLIRLAQKGRKEKFGNIDLITLGEDHHAFSFFNYLFISDKLASSDIIIRHEMVHIRQKHSYDIMYIELLKIVCWFNPAVYFVHRSIKELHEYIVDRTLASEKDDVDRYTNFLIQNAYGLPAIAPANNFFTKNLLKNRIMMLHQKRSGSLAKLKCLVALPLMTGMLCLSTLGFTKDHPVYDIAPKAPIIRKTKVSIASDLTYSQQTKKDTSPKPPKPKVDQVRFPPKPPKPKVDKIRFPPPVVKPDTTRKYLKAGTVVDRGLNSPTMIGGVNASSFLQPTSPLYVVDGVVVTQQNASLLGLKADDGTNASPLGQIPQENIASLEILKEATARSTYGDAGRHGVILITTVNGKAKGSSRTDTVDRAILRSFYSYLNRTIKYPSVAREKFIRGKVFVVFNVNNDNKITNYRILRGLSDEVNAEVIRTLKAWTAPEGFPKNINFTVPLSFDLAADPAGSLPPSPTNFENKATEEPYVKNDFKSVMLNETVIRGYIRRGQ